MPNDDGVNREGLEYRAGYVEGLAALLVQMQVLSMRAKKNEVEGLKLVHGVALELRKQMLEKMKGA